MEIFNFTIQVCNLVALKHVAALKRSTNINMVFSLEHVQMVKIQTVSTSEQSALGPRCLLSCFSGSKALVRKHLSCLNKASLKV